MHATETVICMHISACNIAQSRLENQNKVQITARLIPARLLRPGPNQVNFFGLDKAAHRWARINRTFTGPLEATLFGQL